MKSQLGSFSRSCYEAPWYGTDTTSVPQRDLQVSHVRSAATDVDDWWWMRRSIVVAVGMEIIIGFVSAPDFKETTSGGSGDSKKQQLNCGPKKKSF
jgi:hypothetical protein